ncbi:LIM-like homeobox protein [Fusarium acuminatum]|uniref:LIM-like homeobox protein n=1 Tax=Fusarium acuminatum TaxID=5515 RepID=A0ABZ2WHK1_9HYPO
MAAPTNFSFEAATPDKHATSAPSHHDLAVTPQSLPPLADVDAHGHASMSAPDSEKHPKGKRKRTAKSRPLSQQEYAALQFGNMHVITSDPIANTTTPSKPEKAFPVTDPNVSRFADHISAPPRRFDQTPSMPRSHSDHVNSTPVSMNHDRSYRFYPDVTPNRIDPSLSHEAHGHSHSHSLSGSMSSNVGYLANRWNPGAGSFSTPPAMSRSGDDSFRQSKVRLSMSLDGKAELVSNQGSPSREMPPRPSSTTPSLPQVRQRNLQRSQSTIPAVTLPPITALTNTLPPRLMRGRSRDVHAWESCADAENRDELTAQAENESNGSAIAAINLLRSSSGVQPPSTAKRNASMMKPQRPQQAKKARIDPSGSSISRLETELDDTDKADREYGKVKVSMLVSPTGGDSDKENLTPDEDASSPDPYHRRPLPPPSKPISENPRRVGRVLQEQKSPNLFANRANTAPSRPRSIIKEGLEIFEDRMKSAMPSRENEVEKFMRGSVSPSKKPDMDCVAGLLSLSQGAWR